MAKCGSQKTWHWAHLRPLECDPWWENETQWHRDWKSLFPTEWQEVVHIDQETGEKHVADVKTERGLVIEFQHSNMPTEELRARESFYKNMIWVVDGRSFAQNFDIDKDPLPHPKSQLLEEIVFHSGLASAFFKRSDLENEAGPLYELHRATTIETQIRHDYRGHHFYKWKRPRDIWHQATAPVFLDFGTPELIRLMHYNPASQRCIQRVAKHSLVAKNGGHIEPLSDGA
ncbi:hypothetical protein [Methylomonas albis]|uniref:Competence protein n=1 Tax=Methylomonas albis TaxID=1854563 RepID=A0ABR9CYG4_9GAMM|nr:hypothetical protein [Methylomonas albis]CAD6878938.1 hypothetical protein [Methylomonas albis]